MFRDAPITVSGFKSADPFTDVTLSLNFPQITVFDRPGQGDLDWFIPYADIDVIWENTGGYSFDWSWEGFIISPNFTLSSDSSSYSVECKGAMYLLDNYLAEPQYPPNPIPYERLIKMAFNPNLHPARLNPCKVIFPDGWDKVVPPFNSPEFLGFLKPWGVVEGQLWTGLTTRNTGSWDYLLTGYIQGLLSVMYDEGGSQWTLRKDKGRQPVLYLREIPPPDDPDILIIDLVNPGVEVNGSRDFTQSANIIFGEGSDNAGVVFSGMQVSPDGTTTSYVPFAYSSSVYPTTHNPNFNRHIVPKATHIKFPSGLDEIAARNVARAQLQRFADPGITGTVTLTSDVLLQSGTPFPSMLIKGGRSAILRGLFGTDVLVHITESNVDINSKSVTLTYDSKYRDQLTVSEVRARTRDALTPLRALQVGKYSNTVQDLLLPWSYRDGSGMLPTASKGFYSDIPADMHFPYEEWTKKYPPSDPSFRKYYVKLDKADHDNATLNWAGDQQHITYESPTTMYRTLFDSEKPNDGTIDKSVKIFFKSTSPGNVTRHDVWVDGTGIKKMWTGSKWQKFYSVGFETLLGTLPRLTNNIITLFYMVNDPPNPVNNDIWIQRPAGTVVLRANGSWAATDAFDKPTPKKLAIPVRFSQAGTIRLSQIAAYDKDGNVKPVRFHMSIYSGNGVNSGAMPQLYKLTNGNLPKYLHPPGGDNYVSGQRMPFYKGAFESVTPSGVAPDTDKPLPAGVDLIVGWGNYFEPAGYWPGRASRGADRTGLLIDEATWSWDLTRLLNPNDRTDQPKDAGMLYIMIYCDDDSTDQTYFMGRFFRQEPGTS